MDALALIFKCLTIGTVYLLTVAILLIICMLLTMGDAKNITGDE